MPKEQKSILIVGAGLSGSVLARELADAGHKITIIEKRNHIAGNAFDYKNEFGIRVHRYGPHLFHTSNKIVINWVKKFSNWTPYEHKVKAQLKNGEYVTFPVNIQTRKIVGEENIVDTFYRPYTKKMWGVDIEQIDSNILNRVPMRDDNEDRYFPNDSFQALPTNGYTRFFENVLDHDLIKVYLDTKFDKNMQKDYDHIFNSMPIDEYFDYCFGQLPYRSIKFHTFDLPIPRLLPTATVNFTHTEKFTRATEWKIFPDHGENFAFTTITVEEPCSYEDNNYERYYPVKDTENQNLLLYKTYKAMSPKNMIFVGRCGSYVYLDMHQAISASLSISRKFIKQEE